MGIFDDKEARKQIQYLESERKKLWDRLVKLEQQNNTIQKEITLSATAQNSKKVTEFRNKTFDKFNEANGLVSQIVSKLKDVEQLYSNILDNNNKVIKLKTDVETTDLDYKQKFEELKTKLITYLNLWRNIQNYMGNY